jgi:L-fuconolactonase
MIVVDAHCHAAPSWYEPVESLLFQMERNNVEHAVLIQIQGQFDNSYQAECVRRFPGRFASVVIVDVKRPDALETLARLADEGASGVRFTAVARSPGDDPLAIWRAAARLGLAVSCGGTAAEFASPDFSELVAALPELPIVVEHLGSVNRPELDDAERAARRQALALARYPNVSIKVPGLGEFCPRALPVTEPVPFVQPEPSLLESTLEAFGPSRMMWGSDYPPVSSREGYGNALRFPLERLTSMPGVSDEDRERIFGGTALSVFPIRG